MRTLWCYSLLGSRHTADADADSNDIFHCAAYSFADHADEAAAKKAALDTAKEKYPTSDGFVGWSAAAVEVVEHTAQVLRRQAELDNPAFIVTYMPDVRLQSLALRDEGFSALGDNGGAEHAPDIE